MWWTSAHKDKKTGHWHWDHGNGMDETNRMHLPHEAWYPGEPSNNWNVEFYAAIIYKDGIWGLNDLTRANNLRQICEYEL